MPQILYLDTARLGQISPSAKRALNGALKFNKAYGASAYFDDFLFGGAGTLNAAQSFDGLSVWKGIEGFKDEIKSRLFESDHGEVVFANRTASLMSLAAKMLFARCRNVLVTDLNWNSYRRILDGAKPNKSCRITAVGIKDLILNRSASAKEITELIVEEYLRNECDGIFIPAVCNLGIQLPVDSIIKRIKENAKLRFSVVDAAQAINHIDISRAGETVDFIFGGTHKWLRAYEPMAIAYFGSLGSISFVSEMIIREQENNPLSDPLTRLSQTAASQIEETVNLCPLFAAAGALKDSAEKNWTRDSQIRKAVEAIAVRTGWECSSLNPDMQSRILLLNQPRLKNTKAGMIRNALCQNGVAVTDYPGGICRISLPERIDEQQTAQLETALAKVA